MIRKTDLRLNAQADVSSAVYDTEQLVIALRELDEAISTLDVVEIKKAVNKVEYEQSVLNEYLGYAIKNSKELLKVRD